MTFLPTNDPTRHIPIHPAPPRPITENRLERFLDKIDANDDGNLSHKELSEAADTNNDGRVSQNEKAEMKDKLDSYLQEASANGTTNAHALGQAQQVLSFVEEPVIYAKGALISDNFSHIKDIEGPTNWPWPGTLPPTPATDTNQQHGKGALTPEKPAEATQQDKTAKDKLGEIVKEQQQRNQQMIDQTKQRDHFKQIKEQKPNKK